MKFYIEHVLLWLKTGEIRRLDFEPNKVNVITGASGTGKTEIMSIIDYCLFTDAAISEEKINENTDWYGIKFYINGKSFVIARERIHNRKASNSYYYSAIGEIPVKPESNLSEDNIKEIMQAEFSIGSRLLMPYSGRSIKAGNKISFKYFMLFNTQSENTISNKEVYYDKQNITRYREALERIFDIAFKIEDIDNILLREKAKSLEKEVLNLQKKQSVIENKNNVFEEDIRRDIKRARELNLLDNTLIEPEEYLTVLKSLTDSTVLTTYNNSFEEIDKLNKEKNRLLIKIRNLNRLKKEYSNYLELATNNHDSLKPIDYIMSNFDDLIYGPETINLLKNLKIEFLRLKGEIDNKKPFNININKELGILESQLNEIEQKIEQYPLSLNQDNIQSISERIFFLGELNYKLLLYQEKASEDYLEVIKEKKEEHQRILNQIKDVADSREGFKSLIEGLIQNNLDSVGDALGIYKGYKALFNFKDKSLSLRAPNSIEASHVGSSSNHMFMHLCLFLALHEASIIQGSPYIPQYLILDQPSRPYFGEENDDWVQLEMSDMSKIKAAMQLLNDFIKHINLDYNEEFQFIVLEHIPPSVWKGMENFHLVEEFRYGNALININN